MFNPEYTPYEQKYMDIIEKLKSTFLKKNADYGSSVKKNFDKFESYGYNEGLKYVFGRIAEKYDRLENLIYGDHPNQVIDESIEDTLLDMANYAILATVSLKEHQENKEPIEHNDEPYKKTNIQRILGKLDDKPYYGG